MLQIILATLSATSIHMIYINYILPHLTRGNIPLKIQMEVSSFVVRFEVFTAVTMKNAVSGMWRRRQNTAFFFCYTQKSPRANDRAYGP
jgi:hypothetical protein